MRYVLECIWNGYTASQRRPCHREVVTKKAAEEWRKIHTVQFTDNTTMHVDVREAKPREKVEEIKSYSNLLWKFRVANMTGFVRVADLVSR